MSETKTEKKMGNDRNYDFCDFLTVIIVMVVILLGPPLVISMIDDDVHPASLQGKSVAEKKKPLYDDIEKAGIRSAFQSLSASTANLKVDCLNGDKEKIRKGMITVSQDIAKAETYLDGKHFYMGTEDAKSFRALILDARETQKNAILVVNKITVVH